MSRVTHCDFGDCNAVTLDERGGWVSVEGYVRSTGASVSFQVCPEHAPQLFEGLNRQNVRWKKNPTPEESTPTP